MVTTPRFDGTVNLGHVLTIVAIVGSVTVAYGTAQATLENYDTRIRQLEKSEDKATALSSTILQTLTNIQIDVATIKAKQDTPPVRK